MIHGIVARVMGLIIIAALMCITFLSPITMTASAQKPLKWIRPGLHVSYYALSGSLTIGPWSAHSSVAVSGGTFWTERIMLWKPGQVNVVNIFEHFVVEDIDKDGVHMYYAGWSIKKELGIIKNQIVTPIRKDKPFNGPFWLDPGLLANAREGGSVVIPQEGKKVVYQVVFVGRYDLSPFTKKENMALDVTIPLPRGSVREVIGLRAVRSMHVVKDGVEGVINMVHEMVVDKATGLILMEAVMTSRELHGTGLFGSGGKRAMYARYLAGINMDLENVLPSYNAKDYDYGALISTGYIVSAEGMLSPGGSPSLEGIIVSYSLDIVGVYKDKAAFILSLFIGIQPPIAKTYLGIVDLETGETRIEFSADMVTGKIQEVGKTFPVGPLLIPRDTLGKESLEILGTPYTLMGVREASIEGIGSTKIYVYESESEEAVISAIAYAETEKGGLIVALQPGGIPGYTFTPVQGQGGVPNTPKYLAVINEKAKKAMSVGMNNLGNGAIQQGINASLIEQILEKNTANKQQKQGINATNIGQGQEAKQTSQGTGHWYTTTSTYTVLQPTPQKPTGPKKTQTKTQTQQPLQTKNSIRSNRNETLKIVSINAITAVIILALIYSWKTRRSYTYRTTI